MRRALPTAVATAALLLVGGARAQGPLPIVVDRPELRGAVAGRVCRDVDGDGVCSAGEPGLEGVRLVLSTGREVHTDAEGRFHVAGLDTRAPDATRGLHLRPGRYRLRVDPRTLPAGARPSPAAATVELPWGGVARVDVAVALPAPARGGLVATPGRGARGATLEGERVAFALTGRASPGDDVWVGDARAEVDADGAYRARVALPPGQHRVPVRAESADGSVRLAVQPVDVVERDGGVLLAPRPLEELGRLQLPAARGEAVPSGTTVLHLEAPAGTRVRVGGGQGEAVERAVATGGVVELPLALGAGRHALSVTLQPPGGAAAETFTLPVRAEARAFGVGLLDVELGLTPDTGTLRLTGRGAAHAERPLGRWLLTGEVDLRDTDGPALRAGAADALRPRAPWRFERAVDPDRENAQWADTSTSLTPNASEARLRLSARHPELGVLGLGTHRASLAGGELGRYHRPLFGPHADVTTPAGPLTLHLRAFGGALADPVLGLAALPAHEEFRATGGSVFRLGARGVVEGSERVRVEVRDALSGLPLGERHLVRGRDYALDAEAGRLLLARPLWALGTGAAFLPTGAPTEAPEPVLVVDYARLVAGDAQDAGGAEAGASWEGLGGAALSGVRDGGHTLLAARAHALAGAWRLDAEAAHSRGATLAPDALGRSDDGGLSFLRPELGAARPDDGWGLSLRLRGPAFGRGGRVDAALRQRSAGYADGERLGAARLRQASVRAEERLGRWRLRLLADGREEADPRAPYAAATVTARHLGGGVAYEAPRWGAGVDVRDTLLEAGEAPGDAPLAGGRTSAGVHGHLRVGERVRLVASHRQALAQRGEGPGRRDDTFAAVGADVELGAASVGSVRVGWGPELGPQAWVRGTHRRGDDTYYGGYSVDVDGPAWGAGRAVSGARTDAGEGTALFVEDVASHDADAVRLARAVGLRQAVAGALELEARYERGLRPPLADAGGDGERQDAGALALRWTGARVRAEARAEVREARAAALTPGSVRGPAVREWLAGAALEARLAEALTGSGRLHVSDARAGGARVARFLEGHAALAWRPGPLLLVARYGVERELRPGAEAAFGERSLQTFSLLPAVSLGSRLSLAAGAHAGRTALGADATWLYTVSARPAVRVVGPLELAAEVARRTAAPDGGELLALRAEAAWRLDERLRLAAGYALLGFTGLGFTEERGDRVFVRAELSY